jgi:hypothetical protein
MSTVTVLASGQLTPVSTITHRTPRGSRCPGCGPGAGGGVDPLAGETLHDPSSRFGEVAATAARLFATAATELASIKARRRL